MNSERGEYWSERARNISDAEAVNIVDIFQRNVEHYYIRKYLNPEMKILEVGCGNGFSTAFFRQWVKEVDAFDYSKDMIEYAKKNFGETNNRFFIDDILSPRHINAIYDTVICVRVLINLRNLQEQLKAIGNICSSIKNGGNLILVEGFSDGFIHINQLRKELSLPPLEPAKINFYSSFQDILPTLEKHFIFREEFHLGGYDYLTRVVYPLIVGSENVKHNTSFSEKSEMLTKIINPDEFRHLSRIKGFVLVKK